MEKVSIIIPTFNRKEMLTRCIDSVLKSSYRDFEIIVSDDASSDGTNVALKKYLQYNNFKYIRNKSPELLSKTINNALRYSHGKYIFILDDDNVIDKDCIKNLVLSFGNDENVGIVGPLALYYSKKDRIAHAGVKRSFFIRRAIYPSINKKRTAKIKINSNVEDFANAFMFRRDIIHVSGAWDLLVPFMGEDGDFEARVIRLGYKTVINPSAITYHDIKYDPSKGYFVRLNDMRMYHMMHSKILYEYRYDNLIGKITFTISIPIYTMYYVYRITFSDKKTLDKLSLFSNLLYGIIIGIADSLLGRQKIEWIK